MLSTDSTVQEKGSATKPVIPAEKTTVDVPVEKGARREVFALDEGDVVLTFPDNLSAASYDDLEAYLQLFLRKAKRRAGGEAAN